MNSPYSLFPAKVAVVGVAPKVNDILVSTWGYEQTNASFFKVLRVMGKFVEIVPLDEIETALPDCHAMFGTSVPGAVRGASSRKMFKLSENYGYSVKINSYSTAFLWNGKPVEVSHTH